MHVSNLFYNEPNVRLAERLASRSLGGERVLLQLRRRGQRGGDQARAQGTPARGHRGRPRTRSTGGRTARCRRRRRSPSRRRSRRWCRASARVDATEIAGGAWTTGTAAVLIEPIQGESGVQHHRRRSCWPRSARRATRVGRGAGLRRGPDRHGPDRLAVGLRAARRRPGRDDAGQGPRRRAADRRAGDRRASWRTSSRRATTARRSRAARSSRPPPTRRST